MNTNQLSVHIGVDVGKHQLEFHCHENGEHFTIANSTAGVNQPLKQLSSFTVDLLVMQATGRHERALGRDESHGLIT